MIELEKIWQDYGLDQMEEGLASLFPESKISLAELLQQVMTGDILGAMTGFMQDIISDMTDAAGGMKNIFIWLLVLGTVSALMTHFIEIFDKHQIADLSFYFVYLLMTAVLMKCFSLIMQTTVSAIEDIILFVKLLVPTYLLSVGLATGTATVSASYQLVLLIIYGIEKIMLGVVLPMIYSYCILSMINGIWIEEKLTLLIELIEKCIGWLLKAAIGVVTGVGVFQTVITPVIDSVKASALQKTISALPGIGNAADGVVELVMGSAVVLKNSIGVVLLLLLIILCATPLLQILGIAVFLKGAAAFMGIVSNKRITSCVNRTGEAGMMLFRTLGTAMLLFLITLSMVATATNRGF